MSDQGNGEVARLVADGKRKDEQMEFMQHEIDALKRGEEAIGQGQFFSSQDYAELVTALQLASERVQELEGNEATRDGMPRDAEAAEQARSRIGVLERELRAASQGEAGLRDQVQVLGKELASQRAKSQDQIVTNGQLLGENMDLQNSLDAQRKENEHLRAQAAAPQPVHADFRIDQNDYNTLVSTLEAAQTEVSHLAAVNRQLDAQLSAPNVGPADVVVNSAVDTGDKDGFYITHGDYQALVDALQVSRDSLAQSAGVVQSQGGSIIVDTGMQAVDENGFYITHTEYSGLLHALQMARDALHQSERVVHDQANTERVRQTNEHLAEIAALNARIRDLTEQLNAALSQGVLDQATIDMLKQRLDHLLNDVENLQQKTEVDDVHDDAHVNTLLLDLKAAIARAEKAEAREAICQAELDHLRQRKTAGASETFKQLQDENEHLHAELQQLGDVTVERKGEDQTVDGLTHALLAEIAALQNEARNAPAKSHDTGLKQKIFVNAKRRVKKSKRSSPQGYGVYRRVVHPPAGMVSTHTQQLAQAPASMRITFWVRVAPGVASNAQGLAGRDCWLRIGAGVCQLVDRSGAHVLHQWPLSSMRMAGPEAAANHDRRQVTVEAWNQPNSSWDQFALLTRNQNEKLDSTLRRLVAR